MTRDTFARCVTELPTADVSIAAHSVVDRFATTRERVKVRAYLSTLYSFMLHYKCEPKVQEQKHLMFCETDATRFEPVSYIAHTAHTRCHSVYVSEFYNYIACSEN
jgi:hypothetical protein